MTDNVSQSMLLTQYQTLCRYCDEFFMATQTAFHSQMHCAKGCVACCILETVSPLEAFVIEQYLRSLPPQAFFSPSQSLDHPQEQCALLHQQTCTIYPVRPLICRTHGLPLLYPSSQVIETCPLNFSAIDLTTIDPQFLFDAEKITENLMRLNVAFCMLTHQTDRAGERIRLDDILEPTPS